MFTSSNRVGWEVVSYVRKTQKEKGREDANEWREIKLVITMTRVLSVQFPLMVASIVIRRRSDDVGIMLITYLGLIYEFKK